jgi:hypothetical protein
MSEKIKECYKNDNDDQAFTCIKEAIKKEKAEGASCQSRAVLLVMENCAGCKEEKARYSKDIADGTISVVDIYSPEGQIIAKKNDIYAVPALLILDCKDAAIE